jgi:hypothetical protein
MISLEFPAYSGGESGVVVHNRAMPYQPPKVKLGKICRSQAEVITDYADMREIQRLIRQYGGKRKGWKKMKGFQDGKEYHWYQYRGIIKEEKEKIW